MGTPFSVQQEVKSLQELAKLSLDNDKNLAITARDLGDPRAKAVLDALHVDDYIDGSFQKKAEALTQYFSQLRMANMLFRGKMESVEKAEMHPDGQLSFPGFSFTSADLMALDAPDQSIRGQLEKYFPAKSDRKPVWFSPHQPSWQQVIRGGTIRVARELVEEFKSSYDCAHEQLYLLLANKGTGIIEKALRPKYLEDALTCGFDEGWVDYVGSILNAENSPYVVVGSYHAHATPTASLDEGVKFAATNPSSPTDTDTAPLSEIQLIGFADTLNRNSENFDNLYQVNAFNGFEKYKLDMVSELNSNEVFLDDVIAKYEPHGRGKRKIAITTAELKKLVDGFSLGRKIPALVKPHSVIVMSVSYYYDGSYEVAIRINGEAEPCFVLRHQMHVPNRGGWNDKDGYRGYLTSWFQVGSEIKHIMEIDETKKALERVSALLSGNLK